MITIAFRSAIAAAVMCSTVLAFTPMKIMAQGVETQASPSESANDSSTGSLWARSRLHLNVDLGYTPPLMDMYDYDRGGPMLGIAAQYHFYRVFGLGLRSRLTRLFIENDNLAVRFFDFQAVASFRAIKELRLYVTLGMTLVVSNGWDDVAADPNFSSAVGISYTFGLLENLAMDVGAEVDMMFNGELEHTGTTSGTMHDNVFAHLMFYLGFRIPLCLFGQQENGQ